MTIAAGEQVAEADEDHRSDISEVDGRAPFYGVSCVAEVGDTAQCERSSGSDSCGCRALVSVVKQNARTDMEPSDEVLIVHELNGSKIQCAQIIDAVIVKGPVVVEEVESPTYIGPGSHRGRCFDANTQRRCLNAYAKFW